MEAVPAPILRRVAPQTAAVYNQVREAGPPEALLGLRIAVRRKATEHPTAVTKEKEKDAQSDSSATSGERRPHIRGEHAEAWEEPPELTRACRRQLSTIPTQERDKRRRQEMPPSSSVGSQTQPRRRQGQVPHRKSRTMKQMQAEPAIMEPVDLEEGGQVGKRCSQATQTGTSKRTAAEEARDEIMAQQDDWHQWLPQARGSAHTGDDDEPEVDPHEAATQLLPGRSEPDTSGWGPNQVLGADGKPRAPTSQEREWMEEYEREKEEEQKMDALLADFEDEELLEMARREFEEEELRKEAAAANTEYDSESS